jgi:hypothetical protein
MTALMESRIPGVADSFSSEPVTRSQILTGRGLCGLAVAFLALDCVMKFVMPPVVEAATHLGLGLQLVMPIGFVLLLCRALYVIPRTRCSEPSC